MKKLTEKEIILILNNKLIKTLKKEYRKQVYEFAFGKEFMSLHDKEKGKLKEYTRTPVI
jgi:hypothetical protein|tara:strand:+ start:130 stop:306 length:177 start_codon:yes stop_codon:yes gene_type:complete